MARPSSTIAPSLPSFDTASLGPEAMSNENRPAAVPGSTELTISLSPNASPTSCRIAVTPEMPGASATALAIAGSVGDQPSAPVITCVAAMRRSSVPDVVSRRPWAITVTSVTSATPIISAEAVVAVRPGWRIALRRASAPAEPPSFSAGRPISEARPRTARAGSRSLCAPGSASRSAATGGTRVARQAGIRPATSVTSVPTSIDTSTVWLVNTMPASGRARSIESKMASRPLATPKPAARPVAEASRPMASASSSTEPRIWRRVAPTIRSRPNSRARWATVIESVLKIVNAPTKIATKPNTSSTVRMIEMNCSRPFEREAVVVPRGLHLSAAGHGGGDGLADVGARDAFTTGDEDRVVVTRLAEQRLRGAQVEHGGGRRAQRLDGAEAGDAHDGVPASGARSGHAHVRADRVVLAVGRGGVDHDLVGRGRPAAGIEPERRRGLRTGGA